MEVKINREIRQYTESVFFGLSARQFIFSVLAVCSALTMYFWLEPAVGTERVSWICILCAVPFAFLGFFRYHGLSAEQFISAWIRSEILGPRRLLFLPEAIYMEAMGRTLREHLKEVRNRREEAQHKDEERKEHVQGPEKSAGSYSGEEDMDGRDLFVRKRDLFEDMDIL